MLGAWGKRKIFEKKFGPPQSAKIAWLPLNPHTVSDAEQVKSLLKLLDALEDNDDVQEVFSNFELPETLMHLLDAA